MFLVLSLADFCSNSLNHRNLIVVAIELNRDEFLVRRLGLSSRQINLTKDR